MSARETAALLLLAGRLVQAEGSVGELSPAPMDCAPLLLVARAKSVLPTPSAFAEFQAPPVATASQHQALEAVGTWSTAVQGDGEASVCCD